ncbi:hypothetical protein BpHYR1_028384 [Brachionus plicatilis]|uniref:Uncharacterized protein n=1 Tax=Brachionus plicatilis TaxID=10195 RepID=A0A3M7RNT6_BRAPC|nr:hypothetical protein BpHYR1_028384 [Brachionus plicatilis]
MSIIFYRFSFLANFKLNLEKNFKAENLSQIRQGLNTRVQCFIIWNFEWVIPPDRKEKKKKEFEVP